MDKIIVIKNKIWYTYIKNSKWVFASKIFFAWQYLFFLKEKYMKEEKNIVTDEILNQLSMEILNSEKTVSDLANLYEVDELTILGMIGLLKQKGQNIYKEKIKNDIIITSFGDGKIGSTAPFVINNDNQETKILVISDTWYGSKFSQPSIVNEVYRLAVKQGCDFAFHLGDIAVGRYPKYDEEGRESIFAHGFAAQKEEIINRCPYIEDMPTFFITGEHDHKLLKDFGTDIGNAITESRKDLIYLGPNRRDIILKPTKSRKGIKIRLYHQEGTTTYQISYKSDQYVRALRSENKADIIFQGHSLVQDEYERRNMKVFQVPGLLATAPEIAKNKKYKHNTVGAWIITIKKDNNYQIQRIVRGKIPFYETYDLDYKKAKQLILKKGDIYE